MDILLLERINKLGQIGDVVKVKPGFARNYLIPQGKALRATPENRAIFDQKRAQIEADNIEKRNEATAVAEKMGELVVILERRAGETGQLYGSVNAIDIASGITEQGFTVDRKQVHLHQPIKALGIFKIDVLLHAEVTHKVAINVARSVDEAKKQWEDHLAPPPSSRTDQGEKKTRKDNTTSDTASDIAGDALGDTSEKTDEKADEKAASDIPKKKDSKNKKAENRTSNADAATPAQSTSADGSATRDGEPA
ncbi:MAG: 50S ribosomal protein L9 [Pseudomonadota bacterium]